VYLITFVDLISSLENYNLFQCVYFFYPLDFTFCPSIYTRLQNKKNQTGFYNSVYFAAK